ncbi:MAG: hypothetical protein V1494_03670 [Candidatus Diapherotrites archaeon]
MKSVIRFILRAFNRVSTWAAIDEKKEQKSESPSKKPEELEIQSIWNYLSFNDNTQAFHLAGIIGFEEWVTMDEIRRRIEEVYQTRYLNDRSLYPYIKTLVDCGLFETTNVGGRRKWRKKELLLKLKALQKREEEEEAQAEQKATV